MAHLAEVHISENLEHYADQIQLVAIMMQSHLENAAAALLHLKSISNAKISSSSAGTEEEEDVSVQIASRIDSLVSQTRSVKVVSSKAIRQLEDLKSRCVTLDPSTWPTVEESEQSSAELVSMAIELGTSAVKLFAGEAQTEAITAQKILTALQAGPSSLSSISSKLQSVTIHLHSFYNLTTSLSQAVEFRDTPPDPPWRILAQRMKAANAGLAAREAEMSRLRDEMAEKNTTLAMKDKITEEMGVKLEVLEKRVGESGGRREKVRELEEAATTATIKEQDLLNKLSRLRSELQHAEADREKWKNAAQTQSPSVQPGRPFNTGAANETTTSEASLRQISLLKSEVKTLQSAIHCLRAATHTQNLTESLDFLSTPISVVPPPTPAVQTEAKDVLKEMLGLVARPDNEVVRLQPRPATERLRWRPAKETAAWQVQRQREEWEEWREWRDAVAKKAASARRHKERTTSARTDAHMKERVPLAKLQMQVPGKIGEGKAVQIVDPEEWDKVQQTLGIKVG